MDLENAFKNKMAALNAIWEACKARTEYSTHVIAHHKYQLLEIEAHGLPDVHHVRIVYVPRGNACQACLAADGLVLILANELKKQTLPHSTCKCHGYWPDQNGVCLCYYEIVFDDEL